MFAELTGGTCKLGAGGCGFTKRIGSFRVALQIVRAAHKDSDTLCRTANSGEPVGHSSDDRPIPVVVLPI